MLVFRALLEDEVLLMLGSMGGGGGRSGGGGLVLVLTLDIVEVESWLKALAKRGGGGGVWLSLLISSVTAGEEGPSGKGGGGGEGEEEGTTGFPSRLTTPFIGRPNFFEAFLSLGSTPLGGGGGGPRGTHLRPLIGTQDGRSG